jgi:hypothetical protein
MLVGELVPYVEAARTVAADKQVPLVDLHARSVEVLERMGPEAAEAWSPIKDGKPDHTHLGPATPARHGDWHLGSIVGHPVPAGVRPGPLLP